MEKTGLEYLERQQSALGATQVGDPYNASGLIESFRKTAVHRPLVLDSYDCGAVLTYDVKGIVDGRVEPVTLRVERFVGGGFAGQVYQVRLLEATGAIPGVGRGAVCAMKILKPPSRRALAFREALYRIGFQGPFQLQVNPAAARAGALWQKLIRRAALLRFGTEKAVADIYGTFVDRRLGSTGELLEWIEGRTWLLEVDDNLTALRRWCRGEPVDERLLGSPEYRAKRVFMARFVELLHELGAHELARQYEWWTCKSQPNCLKRLESEGDPEAGLTAVDFRAGLVLLPFLPMSPADFVLIARGVRRGAFVQFDRGDLEKLKKFIERHRESFEDLTHVVSELTEVEAVYRDSVPDVTHHRLRLLTDRRLRRRILEGFVTAWETRGTIDQACARNFLEKPLRALAFGVVGLLGLLAPVGGVLTAWAEGFTAAGLLAGGIAALAAAWFSRLTRRLWGREDFRRHYRELLGSVGYLKRALRAKIAERLIRWVRSGRVEAQRALRLAESPLRFAFHMPFGILPASLHRFLTDREYARERLHAVFVRPVRLYFNAEEREAWLRDMVEEGRSKHMLTDEDAQTILSQIKEPFIQKYLKSLAVHVCTLPVTQLVAAAVALYGIVRFDMSWSQAWKFAGGIFILFQVTPISPGSLLRGLYVVYLVVRERNVRDYNVAIFLSFMKYIGYLAFPIQMTYRYPTLARFMACHWATEAVHVVPVFGERGALLEHGVFNLFYNWPLTVRRRMRERAALRRRLSSRRWHVLPLLGGAAGLLAVWAYFGADDPNFLTLRNWWYLIALAAVFVGIGTTAFAGGLSLGKRAMLALTAGLAVAGVSAAVTSAASALSPVIDRPSLLGLLLWPLVFSPLLALVSALLWEVFLPEPGAAPGIQEGGAPPRLAGTSQRSGEDPPART